jgi:hypothetical protein
MFNSWCITSLLDYIKSLTRAHASAFLLGMFPWTEALAALDDANETLYYSQILLDKLTASLIKEPLSNVIEECQPPSLIAVEDIDCFKYLTAFTGIKRQVRAQMLQGVGLIPLSLIN